MAGEEIEEQRERLLDDWDGAARGWGRQADRMHTAALQVSERMIELVGPAAGERVLELAAGPGDTGFMAARLIAPGGTLISSDAVSGMLEVARERAEEQGVRNVEFRRLSLEWIDLPTAEVDIVLCRWGVMLTLDPAAALRECRRVLKPGGRLALAVWDLPESNPWTTIVQSALVTLGHVEDAPPGGAGMFALSAPGLLEGMLADAGFLEIEIEPVPITRHYEGALDWLGESRDLSRRFSAVWATLSDAERRQLRDHLTEQAAAYADEAGALDLPGSCLVAGACA